MSDAIRDAETIRQRANPFDVSQVISALNELIRAGVSTDSIVDGCAQTLAQVAAIPGDADATERLHRGITALIATYKTIFEARARATPPH